MLLQFVVNNYKSYKNKTVLSFVTKSKIRNNKDHEVSISNLSVLKYAAVFGHNASGKTNLFSSMQTLKELIVTGKIDGDYCFKGSDNKIISFDTVFEKGGSIYKYSTSVDILSDFNTFKIVDESLLILSKRKEEVVFNFKGINKSYYSNDKDTKYREDLYFNNCRNSNKLFLSFFLKPENKLDGSELQNAVRKAFHFFSEDIIFVTNEADLFSVINEATIKDVSDRLQRYDTGVKNLSFVKCSKEEVVRVVPQELLEEIQNRFEELPKNDNNLTVSITNGIAIYHFKRDDSGKIIAKTIKSNHKGIESLFNYDEESEGTRRIVLLCSLLFSRKGNEKVFVFDEFERSLHPCLARAIITDFMEHNKSSNSQLLITTHLPLLMDDVFRKDEIYICEKSSNGVSDIYPLACFKGNATRTDKKISKNYFNGRYGGVPVIDKVIV